VNVVTRITVNNHRWEELHPLEVLVVLLRIFGVVVLGPFLTKLHR
jgi:hypothetical protein